MTTNNLRTRIAKALFDHAAAEYSWGVDGCQCGADTKDKQAQHQADAVIRDVLTPEFLADLVIAAVQKAADDE
jgi:hypothetical protein